MKKHNIYQKGRVLLTKDGSHLGNAIITRVTVSSHNGEPLYVIRTDFGNICRFSEGEIVAQFTPGKCQDHRKRLKRQFKLLGK